MAKDAKRDDEFYSDDISREAVGKLFADADKKEDEADFEETDDLEHSYVDYAQKLGDGLPKRKRSHTESPAYRTRGTLSSDSKRELYNTMTNLDYEDEEDGFRVPGMPVRSNSPFAPYRIHILGITLVTLLLFVFLVIRLNVTSSQLKKAKAEIETSKEAEKELQRVNILLEGNEATIKDLETKVDELETQIKEYAVAQPSQPTQGSQPGTTIPSGTTPVTQTPTTGGSTSTITGATTHTVQAGENYWTISTKHYGDGTKHEAIMLFNGFTNPDDLQIGTVLKLP